MSRDRRWALRWSYFFLVLFAIFFLMPPIYMFITSLKTSAEISAATNPWWVYHPTLANYIELLTSNQYLTFFRNSAIVSVFVVTHHDADQRAGRLRAVAHEVLGLGDARDRRVPDLPDPRDAAVHAAVQDVRRVQRVDRHRADQPLVGAADPLSDADVPFCTWIMIGYFASIPKELDEAALMDGANYRQILTESSSRWRCRA